MADEVFAWSFGAESALVLNDAMDWTMSSTSASHIAPDNTYQYKAAGGVANHSLSLGALQYAITPDKFRPATSAGSIQIAARYSVGAVSGSNPWLIVVHMGGSHIGVKITAAGESALYIANVWKGTSAASYLWASRFEVLTLWYDMTSNPWRAKIQVGGAEANPEASQAASVVAPSSIHFRLYGASSTALDTHIGMVVIREGWASTAPANRYASRIAVDTDVSTVGTWAQTGGASNHAVISGDPLDDTAYTEEAGASAGDAVVCGFSANLASKLGYAPGAIDAVAVYTYSEGLGTTAAATVGDGSSTSVGSTETIAATTTLSGVIAHAKPSSGAWVSTDSPEPGYKVIS